jgi:hypothetical protein
VADEIPLGITLLMNDPVARIEAWREVEDAEASEVPQLLRYAAETRWQLEEVERQLCELPSGTFLADP